MLIEVSGKSTIRKQLPASKGLMTFSRKSVRSTSLSSVDQ